MGFFSKLFSNNKKTTDSVEERTVLNIHVGDIVTYDLIDYEVVGKITYREGGYKWFSYQILEGNSIKWLSAEMDDELELGIYEKIQLPVSRPFPKQLKYNDRTYHKEEEGDARVTGEGRSENINGRTTRYAEYISDDEESYISLESWGSEIEASYGYEIEEYEIKIIAGSK